MEENIKETKEEEHNTKKEETPKITSVVKTERIKDPRRVAQGKKLAAISREAKARKAKEREAIIGKEESEKCEKENYTSLYAIIPAIGIVMFGGYYFLYFRRKPNEQEKETKNSNLENF